MLMRAREEVCFFEPPFAYLSVAKGKKEQNVLCSFGSSEYE